MRIQFGGPSSVGSSSAGGHGVGVVLCKLNGISEMSDQVFIGHVFDVLEHDVGEAFPELSLLVDFAMVTNLEEDLV